MNDEECRLMDYVKDFSLWLSCYFSLPIYQDAVLICLQNDFNFEMRDWMTVQRKELPSGSRLVRICQLHGCELRWAYVKSQIANS